ncbi:MAG: ImmA/IrrE family metallo-endopeptidase [Phycisphaeraceae bacterium]
MSKADDSFLTPEQHEEVRQHARRALEAADAVGVYPTPVGQVLEQAKVVVAPEDALDESFLARIRRKAGSALKQALSKVLGVFDAKARLVYIDRAVHIAKQTFLKLHEAGHAVLPWQRDLYGVIEDCGQTLDPDVAEEFEREANVFASEVLFQNDAFTREAADRTFGIRVPLELAKRYGASAYSAVRRYVSTHHKACAVLVLNPPEIAPGDGFVATLRRAIVSPHFSEQFGNLLWAETYTPDDRFGAMIPMGGRRMSRPRTCTLTDRNGLSHECVGEAFTTGYQVFILIRPVCSLGRVTLMVP